MPFKTCSSETLDRLWAFSKLSQTQPSRQNSLPHLAVARFSIPGTSVLKDLDIVK